MTRYHYVKDDDEAQLLEMMSEDRRAYNRRRAAKWLVIWLVLIVALLIELARCSA